MLFKKLEEKELEPSINMYIDYYNDVEGNKYTYSIVLKKFLQFMNLIDNRCYVLKEENKILGVVLGYIKTYDDLKTYYLEEIVIEKSHQNQNLGSHLLSLVEEDIKKDAESFSKYLKSGNPAPLSNPEPPAEDGKRAAIRSMLNGLKGE